MLDAIALISACLMQLTLDDQVVVFRALPRKNAAAVCDYLTQGAKERLLEGMPHEEVAAILNGMAPDDRTRFLDELPAAATRQLLALLTPEEGAVALTLLGYPEKSVGRLMQEVMKGRRQQPRNIVRKNTPLTRRSHSQRSSLRE